MVELKDPLEGMDLDFFEKLEEEPKILKDYLKTPEELKEQQEEEESKPEPIKKISLVKKRLIPIGRETEFGKPFLMHFPKMSDKSYNVFSCVSPMGGGKSTIFRNLIYWIKKMEPHSVFFIFDPMILEFSKLSIANDSYEKRENLLSEIMRDPETGKLIKVEVQPDSVPVFHVVPRYGIMKRRFDIEQGKEIQAYDETTLKIIEKYGGRIIAEDISRMKEEHIFNILNYDETRTNSRVHFLLRRGIRYCNENTGYGKWFPSDLVAALRIRGNMVLEEEEPTLTTTELELIEKIEKYTEDGVFVVDEVERDLYGYDLREFIKTGRVINIAFMAFKKTEKHGEDVVKGHTDFLLEKIIDISNEYYNAIRKKEHKLDLSEWEEWLLENWRVSIAFEESEIFLPPIDTDLIKTRPCLRRIEYMMSIGRKFGFKNLLLLTQRLAKVNKLLWEETNKMFIGSIIGDQRDSILKAYGVDKVVFKKPDGMGGYKDIRVRDLVTTLKKDSHQWVFIDKENRRIGVIETFDAPVG